MNSKLNIKTDGLEDGVKFLTGIDKSILKVVELFPGEVDVELANWFLVETDADDPKPLIKKLLSHPAIQNVEIAPKRKLIKPSKKVQ